MMESPQSNSYHLLKDLAAILRHSIPLVDRTLQMFALNLRQ